MKSILNLKKWQALSILFLIYLLAYVAGYIVCLPVRDTIPRYFVFDLIATIVTFFFSVIFANSSVYDPYWSLTPMIMSIALFLEKGAISPWQILFLVVFNLWSVRLTANWIIVFSDFSYEDWRYRKFRDENGRLMWCFLNFTGIHLMPTLMVFAGMLPLFAIAEVPMDARCLPGICLILIGIAFEYFADRQMHAHLARAKRSDVCDQGLWHYSRHPNYLGEITVWLGVFITMLPFNARLWYYGIGFIAIAIMFNVVSIPMMEKRQLKRRPAYASYRANTSRLLLLPARKTHRIS